MMDRNFPVLVAKEYPDTVVLAERLDALATEMLTPVRTHPYERGLKYLACSVASSHSALVLLATNGYGTEAVSVSRGMFEAFLTFRYLILRPDEFKNFIDFDAVARWRRLQLYKVQQPKLYESFPPERAAAVEEEFKCVNGRFRTSRGKLMDHWTHRSIAEIAEAVQEKWMYELFYRYACCVSHSDPMGLTMRVDGSSFEIPLGPSLEHVSIALTAASYVMYRTLMQYNHLLKLGFDGRLHQLEVALEKSPVSAGGNPIGWFQAALMAGKPDDGLPEQPL